MNVFYLGKNVKEAVDAPRVHHQLFPMNLFYEDGTTTVSTDIRQKSLEYKKITPIKQRLNPPL
jgi:gamma-glutamyltranspeptidase